MTYVSEVQSETSLRLQFRMDQLTSDTTCSNSAPGYTGVSAATYSTTSGAVTKQQSPAFGSSGYSFLSGNVSGGLSGSFGLNALGTAPTAITFELWYKRNTAQSMVDQGTLFNFNGGGSNQSNSLYLLSDGRMQLQGLNSHVTTSSYGITDGNWHHIAVTYASSSVKWYVDGVLKQTTSGSLTVGTQFGPQITIGSNVKGWVDEAAYYYAELTQTRIQAHYNAAVAENSTPVTVSAPAISVSSVSMPGPVFVFRRPIRVFATAVTMDVTPVVPVLHTNVKPLAPIITTSMTAPVPVAKAGRTVAVSAPAMSISLTQPVPVTKAETVISSAVTKDRANASGYGTSSTITFGTGSNATTGYFYAPIPATPAGTVLAGARFRAKAWSGSNTGTRNASMFRLSANFDETGFSSIGAASASIPFSVTIPTVGGENAVSFSVDITSIVTAWAGGAANFGVGYQHTSGALYDVNTHESGVNGPYIDYVYTALPVGPEIRNVAPAATISLTASAPVIKAGVGQYIQATSASLTAETIAPAQVTAGVSLRIAVPAATASVAFPGGLAKNPDYTAAVTLVPAITVSTPNAGVAIRQPKIVTVTGAMQLSLTTVAPNINLTTNKLTKVFGNMTLNLRMVGIYQKELDRYFQLVKTTIQPNDVWFEMEEKSGQIAKDSVYGALAPGDFWNAPYYQWKNDGYYHSGVPGNADGALPPLLGLDGPKLRKGAARFDGIKQWFYPSDYRIGPPQTNQTLDNFANGVQTGEGGTFELTVEFSIRTTQLNGVIYSGGNIRGVRRNSYNAIDGLFWSGFEVRLEDGYPVVENNFSEFDTKVRRFVADGEWHHIIVAIPGRTGSVGFTNPRPDYIMVDGNIAQRFGGDFGPAFDAVPVSFMARTGKGGNIDSGGYKAVALDQSKMSGHLAGDLRDVIIRNNYITPDLGRHLYWEWSDSVLVHVDAPMTLTIGGTEGTHARGNMKKMMVVFGLEQEWESGNRNISLMVYYSRLSGMRIPSTDADALGMNSWWEESNSFTRYAYIQRSVFWFEDFICYPVSIEGAYQTKSVELVNTSVYGAWYNTSRDSQEYRTVEYAGYGALGVEGILKPEYVDIRGNFVDDTTGARRWLDVNTDLAIPLNEFDVITVVNYPWVKPMAQHSRVPTKASPLGPAVRSQRNRNMTDSEWTSARDRFRDNLLEALYKGVSLWITEPDMAQHLGFIQSYDVHPGYAPNGKWGGDHVVSRSRELRDQGVNFDNLRARFLDFQHIIKDGVLGAAVQHPGDYYPEPQNIYSRRIVALEPGLTDMPSNETGELIVAWPTDEFDVVNDWAAYDVVAKPNGYQIGDLVRINVAGEFDSSGSDAQLEEDFSIISAKPQGIVGKVIAREQLFYYGEPGTLTQVPNPWKDNATTIIAEVGTIMNGRPIGGRVFMEFMQRGQFTRGFLGEDRDKNKWFGSPGIAGVNLNSKAGWDALGPIGIDDGRTRSTWSYDGRRQKKVMVQWFLEKWRFNKNTGDYDKISIAQQWAEYESADTIYRPYWPLPARGLHWLGQLDSIAPGSNRVIVPAATLTVSAPAPTLSKTRTAGGPVPPMEVFLEIRESKNFRSNSYREIARAAKITVELRGTGKAIKPAPFTLNLSGADPLIKAGGLKVTLYLESNDTIKLFIKEDDN